MYIVVDVYKVPPSFRHVARASPITDQKRLHDMNMSVQPNFQQKRQHRDTSNSILEQTNFGNDKHMHAKTPGFEDLVCVSRGRSDARATSPVPHGNGVIQIQADRCKLAAIFAKRKLCCISCVHICMCVCMYACMYLMCVYL
jgi:hypothetical protein